MTTKELKQHIKRLEAILQELEPTGLVGKLNFAVFDNK